MCGSVVTLDTPQPVELVVARLGLTLLHDVPPLVAGARLDGLLADLGPDVVVHAVHAELVRRVVGRGILVHKANAASVVGANAGCEGANPAAVSEGIGHVVESLTVREPPCGDAPRPFLRVLRMEAAGEVIDRAVQSLLDFRWNGNLRRRTWRILAIGRLVVRRRSSRSVPARRHPRRATIGAGREDGVRQIGSVAELFPDVDRSHTVAHSFSLRLADDRNRTSVRNNVPYLGCSHAR